MTFISNWGLALAGGGTRGAYHLGAWKALAEMEYNIDAVVGTSIGSVNAALFVQNDFDRALELWKNVRVCDVLDADGCFSESDNLLDYKNIIPLVQEAVLKNGLQTMPFQRTLERVIDEDKIRKSGIKYGLNTTSLSEIESVELFIEDIQKGELINCIMASSCFPGFQKRYIEDKVYADGGLMNNIPTGMLLKKGYKNIIAVDVGGVGIVKNESCFDANVITVRCRKPLLGIFEFNKTAIEKSIKQGYYDTYKVLGRLMGEDYYFNSVDYLKAEALYSKDILGGLEIAAAAFGIEPYAVYKFDDFVKGVVKYYEKFKSRNTISRENIPKLKSDDSSLIVKLVQMIENDNAEGLNNMLITGILGERLKAAKAVAYFLKNQ